MTPTGVLGGAFDGVVTCRAVRDERGRIVDFECQLADEAAARIAGRAPAELVGRPLLEAFPLGGDAGELLAQLVEVVETGRRAEFVHQHRAGGGRVRWLRTVMVKAGDGLAATFSDVTELKAADRAVAESERRFRAIFNQTRQFAWLLRPDGRVVEANRAALDFCGLSIDDVAGKPFAETPWWPQDGASRRRLEAALAEAARGGHVRYEADARDAACNDAVMDFSVWPMRGGTGCGDEPVELLIAEGRDATPRREVESKLRESRSLYRGVFEHIPIGLFLIDVVPGGGDGLVVEALNPAASTLLGVAVPAAVGRPVAAVFPPGVAADLAERLRGCVEQGQALEYEFAGTLPGAGWRSLRIGLAPIFDEGTGAVTRVIGRMLDITERKQAEEALVHAQKMEAIGQLTGGVAHDFNNLLTVIGGNLELLEYQLQDQPQHLAFVRKALDGVFRAATLTQQLLAYSRKQRLNPEIVDVNRLVDGLHEMLQRTLGETIEIRTLTREGLWPCEVDRGALETVLLNLAVNARDAMPDGGQLTIETDNVWLDDAYAARHPGVQPGPYVAATVTDTGHGIPPELVAHVFEPFFTTKEVGKGSGLGLSMAYGFARQSGGQITIYSEPGAGTTVKLHLPRAVGAGATESPAPGGERRARGPETILVVEDDPEVRRLAVSRLNGLGYRVLEAGDGRAALDAVERHPEIDLLFTDLVMPGGVDGATLAQLARERRPRLRVLYTTGYPDRAVPKRRIGERARLLAKPYRLAELAHKVRTALDVT